MRRTVARRPPASRARVAVSRWQLAVAGRLLARGAVIAYPTEGVFGIGCDPRSVAAVSRVIALKGRARGQGLILIAATVEQALAFARPLGPDAMSRVLASWPGPTTWVLPARADAPRALCATGGTIAVRVTAHPVASALCRRFGAALVSTSANRRGQRPAESALQVRLRLWAAVDFVVPGRVQRPGQTSEIRDAASGRVLRAARPAA